MRKLGKSESEMRGFVQKECYGTIKSSSSNKRLTGLRHPSNGRGIFDQTNSHTDLVFLNNRDTDVSRLDNEKPLPFKQSETSSLHHEGKSVRRSIQNAFQRKKISASYHTNLPSFMRSQGPF